MRILIVRNNSNSQAIDASLLLSTYLQSQGVESTLINSVDLIPHQVQKSFNSELAEGIDMAVALGGDGTILRLAQQVGTLGVPILGINFGHLGFLANSNEEGVVAVMAAALAGEVVAEKRTNLRIDVVCEGDQEEASKPHRFFALNELAITRGAKGRVIDFSLDIADDHIANMRGDGLVVATATGSTAYALSAGGPLVSPGYNGLVVVPIAPHTLHSRAVLTASNDVVQVKLLHRFEGREATLSVDGNMISFEHPVESVTVRRGESPTILLRYSGEGFYQHAARIFF